MKAYVFKVNSFIAFYFDLEKFGNLNVEKFKNLIMPWVITLFYKDANIQHINPSKIFVLHKYTNKIFILYQGEQTSEKEIFMRN